MCDDLASTMQELEAKGFRCTPPSVAEWGTRTTIVLPSGGEVGLYEPSHPRPGRE